MLEYANIYIIYTSGWTYSTASINGFIYSLHHTSGDTLQWRCEKRGTCNAILHALHDIVVKPDNPEAILTSHTHVPDVARIEMLKGYSEIKRQAIDSEISTRSILSAGIQKLHPCSIAKLPEFQSIKQTIRNHKSADEETCETQLRCRDSNSLKI